MICFFDSAREGKQRLTYPHVHTCNSICSNIERVGGASAGNLKQTTSSSSDYGASTAASFKMQLSPVDTPMRGLSRVYETNDVFSQGSLHFSFIMGEQSPIIAPMQSRATMSSDYSEGIA